jgi:hypothetical protein
MRACVCSYGRTQVHARRRIRSKAHAHHTSAAAAAAAAVLRLHGLGGRRRDRLRRLRQASRRRRCRPDRVTVERRAWVGHAPRRRCAPPRCATRQELASPSSLPGGRGPRGPSRAGPVKSPTEIGLGRDGAELAQARLPFRRAALSCAVLCCAVQCNSHHTACAHSARRAQRAFLTCACAVVLS